MVLIYYVPVFLAKLFHLQAKSEDLPDDGFYQMALRKIEKDSVPVFCI